LSRLPNALALRASPPRDAQRDPGYCERIGRLGGVASMRARRDKCAAVLAEEMPVEAVVETRQRPIAGVIGGFQWQGS